MTVVVAGAHADQGGAGAGGAQERGILPGGAVVGNLQDVGPGKAAPHEIGLRLGLDVTAQQR
ncbi:hypothetical protein [Thermostaphylospora chromogena]|uniref:hypothetical protein n=1 Tax=Thermostaphylospora chromogena TaxID=35622 RepID=UPI001F61C6F3|nr:hypothetical protein [Thermostaphylospora chromogena]